MLQFQSYSPASLEATAHAEIVLRHLFKVMLFYSDHEINIIQASPNLIRVGCCPAARIKESHNTLPKLHDLAVMEF